MEFFSGGSSGGVDGGFAQVLGFSGTEKILINIDISVDMILYVPIRIFLVRFILEFFVPSA